VFDGSGNLYVANAGDNDVTVYAPGSTSVLRTISQGVSVPDALGFDGSGNLYVVNYKRRTVTVYAPGKTSVLRTISQGLVNPRALAFGP
jgi:DNA-binding beta-propeller fold protein YncE